MKITLFLKIKIKIKKEHYYSMKYFGLLFKVLYIIYKDKIYI